MATVRPLIRYADTGQLEQLRAGDSLPGGGGGGFANTVVVVTPDADQADWIMPGRTQFTTALCTPANNSFIGGVATGVPGDVLILKNASASGLIWLVNEELNSSNFCRFNLHELSVFLMPGDSITLVYDDTSQRWNQTALSQNVLEPDHDSICIYPNITTSVVSVGSGATSNTATLSTVEPLATPLHYFGARSKTQISNSTANGSSSVRGNALRFRRGNTTGLGGIFFNAVFDNAALGATGGVFFGLNGGTGADTAQPRNINNSFGLGTHGGETSHRLYTRDGVAATAVDLGANFPSASATACYELAILAMPNASNIRMMIRRIDSVFTSEQTFTTNLPGNTVALAPRANVIVGATAVANTARFSRLVTRQVY